MPTDSGLRTLFCGGASMLLALAACSTQAQVAEEKSTSNETIVVTQPSKSRAVTRVVTRETPPDGQEQVVRIERKNTDGDEQIELWINGKKVDVKDMKELEGALGDLNIQFFDELGGDEDGPGAHVFQVQPGDMQLRNLGQVFSGAAPAQSGLVWSEPKSMLGVQLAPISDDLRDYLGLEGDAGVRVDGVVDDSPAAKAGLKAKDIIIAARIGSENHESITADELRAAIAETEPDTKVTLTVLRKGDKKKITATLTKWKSEPFGLAGGGANHIELVSPDFFSGRRVELDSIPEIRERMRLIEPQMRELDIDRDGLLQLRQRALPNTEELMRRMEVQMKQVEEMLKQLQEQQNQLRQQVEKSPEPEA